MEFIRFGGLNQVKQTNKRAPAGKGIWAFPKGFVDLFFLSGTDKLFYSKKEDKYKTVKSRHFYYKGDLWVHADLVEYYLPKATIKKYSDRGELAWVKISYKDFKKLHNILSKAKLPNVTKRKYFSYEEKIKLIQKKVGKDTITFSYTCPFCNYLIEETKYKEYEKKLEKKFKERIKKAHCNCYLRKSIEFEVFIEEKV